MLIKISKILGLVFVSVILSLLVLEVGVRLTTKKGYAPYDWIYQYPTDWPLNKNRIFSTGKVEKALNQYDSKNTVHPFILTIGDSFTQGDPVLDKDNFPSVLHNDLEKKGINNTVINLGIGGYGPDQELTLLKEALAKGMRPDFVVWEFFSNDIYENIVQAGYDIDSKGNLIKMDNTKNWIYRTVSLYNTVPLPNSVKQQSRLINEVLVDSKHFEFSNVPKSRNASWEPEQLWATDKMSLELAEAKELAEQYHFTLYPVLISSQYNYTDHPDSSTIPMDWIPDSEQTLYMTLKDQPNFIYMNFNKLPADSSVSAGLNRDNIADQYFDDGKRDIMPFGNRHFNEAGYNVWAKITEEQIEKELLR